MDVLKAFGRIIDFKLIKNSIKWETRALYKPFQVFSGPGKHKRPQNLEKRLSDFQNHLRVQQSDLLASPPAVQNPTQTIKQEFLWHIWSRFSGALLKPPKKNFDLCIFVKKKSQRVRSEKSWETPTITNKNDTKREIIDHRVDFFF